MPKRIDVPMRKHAPDIPHATNQIIAEDQAEEKWNRSSIRSQAAVLEQNPFNQPTDEDRCPHPTHRPVQTAC